MRNIKVTLAMQREPFTPPCVRGLTVIRYVLMGIPLTSSKYPSLWLFCKTQDATRESHNRDPSLLPNQKNPLTCITYNRSSIADMEGSAPNLSAEIYDRIDKIRDSEFATAQNVWNANELVIRGRHTEKARSGLSQEKSCIDLMARIRPPSVNICSIPVETITE